MPKIPQVSPDTTRRTMLQLYGQVDEIVRRLIAESTNDPVSCRRGCAHCCTIATVSTLGECRAIAHHLHRRADWADWLPKLRQSALSYCESKVFDRDFYFRKGNHRCPFLDEKLQECQIYEVRPACCRLHFSIDPAEMCSAAHEGTVRYLDLKKLQGLIWRRSSALVPHLPLAAAPVPLAVLFFMQEHRPERQRLVLQHFEGLVDPITWYDQYGKLKTEADPAPAEVADLPKEQEEPSAEAKEG